MLNTARQRIAPPRVSNAAANYFLAFRQIGGVVLIACFTALAWLLVQLPVPFTYTALAGYGVGLALFFLGTLLATRGRTFGKATMGAGAALVYFFTVTLLFDGSAFHLPLYPYGSIAVCIGLLVCFALLAWRAVSQSVSLLTLCLALYTFYTVVPMLPSAAYGLLSLLTVILFVVWIFIWTTYRRERLFVHFALFLTYAGLYYILGTVVQVTPGWLLANTSLLHVSMIFLAIDQAFREHARHKSMMFFSCANVLLYAVPLCILFAAPNLTVYLWFVLLFVLATSVLAALLLYFAHGEGLLISLHAVVAVLALLTCLLLPLSPGFRLAMLAAGCLAPAFLSCWRHDRLLRYTEYGLLVTVFLFSFSLRAGAEPISLGFFSVPVQWAWLLGAATILCLTSRLHTFCIPRQKGDDTEDNVVAEQEMPAFACAFTAALLVTLHTILSRGDSEILPLILSVQGMVFLGFGMTLFTPMISLAGLVPVVAGHAVYYAFPYLAASPAWPSVEIPASHVHILIVITLSLAFYADNFFLKRLAAHTGTSGKLLAVIPYLPAVVLLLQMTLESDMLHYLPAYSGISAAILLLLTFRIGWNLPGMSALGIAAALFSVGLSLHAAYISDITVHALTWFLPLLSLHLVSLVAIERLLKSHIGANSWKSILISYSMIAIIATVGVSGLYCWNSGGIFFVGLAFLSVLFALCGRLLHAKGYYHAAALLLLLAMGLLLLFGGQGINAVTNAIAAN